MRCSKAWSLFVTVAKIEESLDAIRKISHDDGLATFVYFSLRAICHYLKIVIKPKSFLNHDAHVYWLTSCFIEYFERELLLAIKCRVSMKKKKA